MAFFTLSAGTIVWLYDRDKNSFASFSIEKTVTYDTSILSADVTTWRLDRGLCGRIKKDLIYQYDLNDNIHELIVVDLPKNKMGWTHLIFNKRDSI